MKFSNFLNESPLPTEWDINKFKGRLDFRSMIDYAQERVEHIGAGTSRIAFKFKYDGKETVLKFAKNPKGIDQNMQEVKYLNDNSIKNLDIIIPLIDYDKTNVKPRWVHLEYANKFDENKFIKEIGEPLKDVVMYVYNDLYNPKNFDKEKHEYIGSKINKDSYVIKDLHKIFKDNKDLSYGDIARTENWGIYKNKFVIIDIGLDSTSMRLYKLGK